MKRVACLAACALVVIATRVGAANTALEGAKDATASIQTQAKLVPGGVDVTCTCRGGKAETKHCTICNHMCDCGADGQTPTITCIDAKGKPL